MGTSDVSRFLYEAGRLIVWPKKQTDKELVTGYLATKFDFNKIYHEHEVNEILKEWHVFGDWPLLRRELFERGYVSRNKSGSDYKRIK